MKKKSLLSWLLVAALLLSGLLGLRGAEAAQGDGLRLLRSDGSGILMELSVPGYQVEGFTQDGVAYQQLVIPGMTQSTIPGEPQVPTRGVLLGVPGLAGLSLQVREAHCETLTGYRLAPAPEVAFQGLRLDDPAGSLQSSAPPLEQASDAFSPAYLAQIGGSGYLRDQAYIQVQLNPIAYNPTRGQVRLCRHLLVAVTWDPAESDPTAGAGNVQGSSSRSGPAYETVLQKTLFNYASLGRSPAPALADRTNSLQSVLPPLNVPAGELTPTLKIGVRQDGLYQLTYADLAGAGFDPSGVDPRDLQIEQGGSPVPILVQGEADGSFDSGDAILFYGTYTTENVYWLSAGSSPGLRIGTRSGVPGSAPVPADFPTTLHAEQDTLYWQTMPNGSGEDHWFWGDRLSPSTQDLDTYRDYSVNLANLATEPFSATVRVHLKGYTNDAYQLGDHDTRIYVNGHLVGDQTWDGFNVFDQAATFPQAYLVEAANAIRVEAVDTGAAVDQLFVNWIELDYQDTYTAEGDQLDFGAPAPGTYRFQVAGFSSDQVQVFDLADRRVPVLITGSSISLQGNAYRVDFQDNAGGDARYLALGPAAYQSPASLALDTPSAWKSPANGADYIIITHQDFYTDTLALAAYRQAQGLRVAVVKVQDIYDEFNAGIFNPQAIRDFLAYAYGNWQAPAPVYVLLVGEASYDYRGTLDPPLDRVNYVPTQMIETFLLGQTASDNWFVTVSGDDILPDMYISRLPASNATELENMIAKVLDYDQNPPAASWNEHVLLVADDDEASFEDVSESLAASLPYYYQPTRVYVGDYSSGNPSGDPTGDISAAIDQGSLLVDYAGHGNPEMWGVWSGGHIYDNGDVAGLSNAGRYPVVSVANCLNGFFVGRTNPSMAEQFLQLADKGAVAVWAPTGLGYPEGHRDLLEQFYTAIFRDDVYELGAATTTAKLAMYGQNGLWGELVETFVLFGDPATRLGLPDNYPYLEDTIPADGVGLVPGNQSVVIEFNKAMDPASVVIEGLELPVTPLWSADGTTVTFNHPAFAGGQTYNLTVSGQDKLGNPLGAGMVPATWSFTVARSALYLPVVTR
jgi:hypothetical protein